MKLKKITAILVAGTMALSLAGCGGSATEGKDSKGAKEGGETTLTLWSIATESDAFHEPYVKAIEDYEAAHPGVKIKMETFENESYKTKLKSAVAANELPDIFYTWSGGFSSDFIETGEILPLDDYYTKYAEDLPETAITNNKYDGKLYGTTSCLGISMMFYNKKILDENNVKVPTTIDELKEACATLKAAGITPITTSVKETWVLNMLGDSLTIKSAGPEAVQKALTKQGEAFKGDDFLAAAQALVDLKEQGAFIDGATGISNDESMQEFYQGNAAICFMGNWMAGNIYANAPNPEDFDCAPIPLINPEKAKENDFIGGGTDAFMVSADTADKDLAANAAFELNKNISKYAYMSGIGVPAWNVDYEAEVSPILAKIVDYASEANSFTLNFDVLMSADDAGVYLDLMQQLYVGDITVEEFGDTMNAQLGNE